jgi:hypothetical protein
LALPSGEYGGGSLKKGVSEVETEQWRKPCVFFIMSLIGPLSSSSISAAKAAANRARASQKPKAASGLRASLPEQMDSGADEAQDRGEEDLDHSGTELDVPFRDAQHDSYFTPTFITQLLGQLLPNPEKGRSGALAAYKELYARIRNYDRIF